MKKRTLQKMIGLFNYCCGERRFPLRNSDGTFSKEDVKIVIDAVNRSLKMNFVRHFIEAFFITIRFDENPVSEIVLAPRFFPKLLLGFPFVFLLGAVYSLFETAWLEAFSMLVLFVFQFGTFTIFLRLYSKVYARRTVLSDAFAAGLK